MNIEPISREGNLWDLVIEYAENCSWRAGPFLAQAMREEKIAGWERVFVAREKEDIAGYCTLTKTDCIPNVAYTPYIGFVFVGEPYRGKRLSQRLIQRALEYAKELGFSSVYLVSGEQGLYEKYGFTKIEDAKDCWGRDEQIFVIST
jgi:predicted N-acetyltransferase YhbS